MEKAETTCILRLNSDGHFEIALENFMLLFLKDNVNATYSTVPKEWKYDMCFPIKVLLDLTHCRLLMGGSFVITLNTLICERGAFKMG